MNEALRDFPDRVRRAIDGLSEAELTRPEKEGTWSIAEVIAHLAQFEMIVALRIRMILTADTPPLIAFDQERWIAGAIASRSRSSSSSCPSAFARRSTSR